MAPKTRRHRPRFQGLAARTAFIVGKDGKIKDVMASEIAVGRDFAQALEKTRAA